MKNRKRNRYLLLLLLLLGITIGYAALSTTLKINGSANITKNTWSVYWDSVGDVVKTDTTTVTTPAAVDTNDNTQVNFGVTLNLPGDFYEFQVDAVNNGTIDAMVNILTTLINGEDVSELPNYIKYEMTYADGGEILPNHLLAKKDGNTPTRERIKVRIEYLTSVTNEQVNSMPDDEPYIIDIDLDYKQADDEVIDKNSYPKIPSCPDCTFAYYNDYHYFVEPNPDNQARSVLVGGSKDYTEIVDELGNQRNSFLGHVLDNDGKITRAFSCAIKDGVPFCIEGAMDDSKYFSNLTLVSGPTLWNNTCDIGDPTLYIDTMTVITNNTSAGCYGQTVAVMYANGDTVTVYDGHSCIVSHDHGYMLCT